MEECLTLNQAFLLNYGLTVKDGAILSALNGGSIGTTSKELVESLPLVNNQRQALNEKLKELEEKQLISHKLFSDEQAYKLLNQPIPKIDGCKFCGIGNVNLHAHHYPVRRADGGTETINICPNCHTRFHMLTDYEKRYYFNEPYQTYWNFTKQQWHDHFERTNGLRLD